MNDPYPDIPTGSVWFEKETGRRIKITRPADPPAWCYIDAKGDWESHSKEHDNWFEHYCDAYDFLIWGRFERQLEEEQ